MLFFKKNTAEKELEAMDELRELVDEKKYADFANAHKIDALRFAVKLCNDNKLPYFCFGRLLAGCMHYGEFGSPSGSWDLGLLREDYEKLYKLIDSAELPEGVYFEKYYDKAQTCPYEIIRLVKDGTYVEGDIEIPNKFAVMISPFDHVPEQFDLQNSYKRRTRRANRLYHTLVRAQLDKEDGYGVGIFPRILRLFVSPIRAYRFCLKKATEFSECMGEVYGRAIYKKSAFVLKDDVFPTEQRKFYDFTLACPKDISPWTAVSTPELTNQINKIQKADLELLKEFDKICRKLDIGYFVCGGTMLGQIRHGGFIPWDDDIDVALLRRDYDRFLKEGAPLLNTEKFFMQTRKSDPEIPYLFSKIRLNNSTYITKYNQRRNFHKGICLDLFPFDTVPDDEQAREKLVEKITKRVKKHNKVVNIAGPEPEYEYGPVNFEDRFFRIFGKVHRWVYKRIPLSITQKRYIKIATKYNDKYNTPGYTTVASFVPSYTEIKIDDLLPYRDVKFENQHTFIPNKAEVFLTMQYGDYMALPPKHQQVGHGLIGWSLDN